MQTDYTPSPQVEFHGTGIRVNGVEVSGESLLAWFIDYADSGYVRKFDAASRAAFDRTEETEPGLFDSITHLIQTAGGLG